MTLDRLRLITKVARLYYEHGLRQPEIAERLSTSQATVSRLLSAAEKGGIVRTTVMTPLGVRSELEEELERRYQLRDAVVADCEADTVDQVIGPIGSAAATYLDFTIGAGEVVGISSWSETLLRAVASMHPRRRDGGSHVVQILGGIGKPTAEAHAIKLTEQLASLLRAEPHFLTAPGITASPEAAAAYLSEVEVQETRAYFQKLTTVLVGIGSLHPSRLIGESGNAFSQNELRLLRRLGAVGDICLHFFDASGLPLGTPLDSRVIAISMEQLRRVPRSIGLAGGAEKVNAIRGALIGGLVNVLITDSFTAEKLASD